jgi:DNA-binding NarL/FixJ family response regulator
MSIRILVADKYPVIRSGIQYKLQMHPNIEVIGEAIDYGEMMAKVRALHPDILIVDPLLADSQPTEVISHVRNIPQPPRILVLTTCTTEKAIVELIGSGAQGYLLKTDEMEDIVDGVQEIASGKTWLSKSISAMLVHALQDSQNLRSQSSNQSLTNREHEILALIVQGYDTAGIARKLVIEEGTVRNHICNIYSKIEVHSRAEAMIWAWKNGFVEYYQVENVPAGDK